MYWHPVKGMPTTWGKQYECFFKLHLALSHISFSLEAFLCIPAPHECERHLGTLITLNEKAGKGM